MINFYKTQDEAKKEKNIANFLRVTFLDEWNRNANNGMLKMNMLRITKRPCVWWQLQNRVSYWPSKWDTSNWGFLSWWRVSIVPLLKTSYSFTKKSPFRYWWQHKMERVVLETQGCGQSIPTRHNFKVFANLLSSNQAHWYLLFCNTPSTWSWTHQKPYMSL